MEGVPQKPNRSDVVIVPDPLVQRTQSDGRLVRRRLQLLKPTRDSRSFNRIPLVQEASGRSSKTPQDFRIQAF